MKSTGVTCPYCGTKYLTFQSNCTNCGASLPLPGEANAADVSHPPPSPPRNISDSYVWRLMRQDGWAIAALVFLILGIIFAPLGLILTIAIITAFVGIPFALLGLAFLGVGIVVLVKRYQSAKMVVNVLQNGRAVRGLVTSVDQNYSVQINGRSPWNIAYQFTVDGRTLEGKVSTLDDPDEQIAKGNPYWVLYLADAPENNSLYPHP